jgi:hypothetical protein
MSEFAFLAVLIGVSAPAAGPAIEHTKSDTMKGETP